MEWPNCAEVAPETLDSLGEVQGLSNPTGMPDAVHEPLEETLAPDPMCSKPGFAGRRCWIRIHRAAARTSTAEAAGADRVAPRVQR